MGGSFWFLLFRCFLHAIQKIPLFEVRAHDTRRTMYLKQIVATSGVDGDNPPLALLYFTVSYKNPGCHVTYFATGAMLGNWIPGNELSLVADINELRAKKVCWPAMVGTNA
jgi:hypothetical protein